MLKFLGIGSAFNTELLNNSAFIKENNRLLLIDCGGMIFDRIQELRLLDNIEEVNIIITHIHPDHVGSLGDLIFYIYYKLNKKVKVYHPSSQIVELLKLLGVSSEFYDLENSMDGRIKSIYEKDIELNFNRVSHVGKMESYGFILKIKGESLYYSGDSNKLPVEILNKFLVREIDYIYHDTCGVEYTGNAHMYIERLENLIPEHLREFVYCMHIDKTLSEEKILESGFNMVHIFEK
ncbi:MAG: MBL fold metallo-hydrolase [Sarcina sp.]